MIIRFSQSVAALIFVANPAFAACEGPDEGAASTVMTIPANERVSVFHYRASDVASVIEFCVREAGSQWTLWALHGTDQNKWSILQSWDFPKSVQIKTRAYANGTLNSFQSQTRVKTTFGYSFSWFDRDPNDPNDQIVYCYGGATGCPASNRK